MTIYDNDPLLIAKPTMSDHAAKRARQRGALERSIAIVANHADRELRRHDGRRRISLSCQQKLELIRGGMAVQEIERAARIELVEADDGTIVTILKINPSQNSRRLSVRRGRVRNGYPDNGR